MQLHTRAQNKKATYVRRLVDKFIYPYSVSRAIRTFKPILKIAEQRWFKLGKKERYNSVEYKLLQ